MYFQRLPKPNSDEKVELSFTGGAGGSSFLLCLG
jgi:hypothetical protein